MPQIKLGANRAYPSLPTVSGDVENHTVVLNAIREAMEIHERRTRKVFDSFVRVQELVDLGIVNIDGETGVVLAPNDDTDGSDTHNHDSLYIRLDGASPPTTGSVEFGAPVSMTGTLSVDGTVTVDDDLGVTGAITAASYGGINEDNLVDKAAVEAITGNWTFSGTLVIPEAAVTDHEAALSITESQISDFGTYLTTEVNDLTAAVVWTNVPDANITEGSVTQHEAALSITESQISDFGTYLTDLLFDTTPALGGHLDSNSYNITIQGGAALRFEEESSIPITPVANYGVVWVKNDTPNTLWFTDDAGTDFQLGVGGGLADVVDDTSPQLGGDLDVNGNDITGLDTLTLSSTGDVGLFLKADTDNSGEDDNPFIRFEQDGNLVNGVIGLTGASSVDAQGNTFTNAGNNGISIHSFSNGGTAGNIALGCEGAVALAIASDNAAEFFSTVAFSSASPLIASGKSSLSSTQLYIDGKKAFRSVGTWLYMNDGGDFSSGMFTPGIVRADGGLNAGNGDFTASSTGDVYSDRQYTGGFGAMTTGGTTDFNHSSNARSGMGYTLLRGSDTNGPGAGLNVSTSNYNHILNFEYSSKTGGGNLLQYALPYTNGDAQGIRQRTRVSATWGSWVEYLHTGNGGLHYAAAETFSSSKVTVGTGAASGGSDGDIHYRY